MGILNVTPDSFSDGGRYLDPGAACAQAHRMVEEGADIIDVGGESTRPGAPPVPAEEELRRLLPVVRRLVRELAVPISVDTWKGEVAEGVLDAGVDLINDTRGAEEERLLRAVAASGASLVIMHMKGTPQTMQENPQYADCVAEVRDFLAGRVERAAAAGIAPEGIMVDPGLGFGKRREHNLALLADLPALLTLGKPVLVGPSRKSFIGMALDLPLEERLEGTAACVAVAVWRGASAVRVHDVKEMVRVARMVEAIRSCRGTDLWSRGEKA